MRKYIALLGFAIAAAGLLVPPAAAQEKRPIRIGVLDPYSGPLAAFGLLQRPALEFAIEEAGGQVAGRKIEVIYEDEENKPDVALTKVRRLVEQHKIDVLLGPVNSAVCFAVRDYVVKNNVPWLVTFCTSQELTSKYGAPNLFRVNQGTWQYSIPGGRYAVEKLGLKKGIIVGLDYVAGHAAIASFNEGYKAAGGEVVEQVLIPLGMTDAVPYVTKINSILAAKRADSVLIPAVWSSDGIRLIKTMAEFGIMKQVPVYSMSGMVNEGAYLPALGDAALGIKTYAPYVAGIENPQNRKFREALQAKTKKPIDEMSYAGYIRGRVLIEALRKVNGNVEDRAALIKALESTDFVGPAGRIVFDKNHDPVPNVYLTEVRRVDGQLRNVVLDTIVSAGK
jgi:branched-chain amino acid transport system substrate-binding protein